MAGSSEFWNVASGVVGGFLLGVVTNLISPPIYDWVVRYGKRWTHRRRARQASALGGEPPFNPVMTVGDRRIDWIVLQYSRYQRSHIQATYDPRPARLHPGFERLRADFVRDHRKRLAAGGVGLPYNSDMYTLEKFDVGSRAVIEGEELPVLRMAFRPTDYFTQLVTDLNVNNPLRRALAENTDLTSRPVPEFASILGVNINLITRDGYLVVSERSQQVHVGQGSFHTSVAENILRPVDAGQGGAPDPFRCAVRGVREEIGVLLEEDAIELTTFGVQPQLCQYSLIGWARLSERSYELERSRSLAVPKDKFENSRLHFVPATPEGISRFVLLHWNQWFPVGLAAVVLSLFQLEYSEKQVNEAFLQTSS